MSRYAMRLIGIVTLAFLLPACNLLSGFLTISGSFDCDISPRQPDHPVSEQMLAPVGEYPVWFVTVDSIAMSELALSLPPYNGGTVRKSLVVVTTDLTGDLVITGHQLDGDAQVLFPVQIDEEVVDKDGNRTIIYSADDLAPQMVIPNAKKETFGTRARGYATHPWSAYYPVPGCYQLTGAYGGYTAHAIIEVRDE
ncbi:MAG: hypothetical protein LCI00_23135 [Chloroflexi bacterium]|nr:hypothetical protein [Chloroflexota bacterium]MCC6895948.1 hypothetical protein [Anaerolineae bacterium]